MAESSVSRMLSGGAAFLAALLVWSSPIVAAGSVASASLGGFAIESGAHPQDALRRGVEALRAGNLRDAADYLRRAVALDPDSLEARFWLGMAHLQSGDSKAAVEQLRQAEQLAESFEPRIVYQLGVALMRVHRLDEASRRFEQLEALDPGHPEPRLNLGWIAMQRDDAARALELFEGVIRDHPENASAYYFAGRVHEGLADFAAARSNYLEAISRAPDFLAALLALGDLATRRGDLVGARTILERAVEAHPRSADAHAKLGELEARQGQIDAAIIAFEAALSIEPEHQEARYNLGLAYARAGREAEAKAALEAFDETLSALAQTERDARLANAETRAEELLRRGRADIEAADWRRAIDALEQVTVLTPGEADAWELLVRAYDAVGDQESRDAALRQLALLRRSVP